MKLGYKLIFSFLFLILLMSVSSLFSVSYVLEKRTDADLLTRVAHAKTIGDRLFKEVADKNSLAITDVLFDEKKVRSDKIEYIIVFDDMNYLLSHTYLSVMSKTLINLKSDFDGKDDYNINVIKEPGLYVYDVSVPIMEGIKQVGTIHIGVKGSYLDGLKKSLIKTSIFFTSIISLIALAIGLFLTKQIVGPVEKLRDAADKVTSGDFDFKIPEPKGHDEITELTASTEMLITAFKAKLGVNNKKKKN